MSNHAILETKREAKHEGLESSWLQQSSSTWPEALEANWDQSRDSHWMQTRD
jgi:hypothetical protein